ncbi:DUF983 domain-containing protein [Wenyingzhuangia sp. IMCC45467]
MNILQITKSILGNECPKCGKGKVYKDKNILFSIKPPKMNDSCCVCNNKFMKEPGFFIGAMYVGYGLGVAEALLTYLIASQFFDKSLDLRIIPIIVVVMLLLTFFNIKLSRLIWIYMFRNIK